MKAMHTSTFAPRLRPLAAALATLGVVSTAVCELPLTHAAALNVPFVIENCNDDGVGSLRHALTFISSGGIVDLTQLSCSTISLTTGALVIPQSTLVIKGPGRNNLTIDGGNSGAVLSHLGNDKLILEKLSIINGNKYSGTGDTAGGCVHSSSNLVLDDVSISHCKVSAGNGHSAYGGGVFTQGYATIDRSTISDSSAVAIDHGGRAGGGGIYVGSQLSVSFSTIADNVASSYDSLNSFGGGVVASGFVRISDSTISQNHADEIGGLDLRDSAGNSVTITNSTISGNQAMVVGGMLVVSPFNLYNSTIAFNTSSVLVIGQQYFAAGVHTLSSGRLDSTIISNNVNSAAPFVPSVDLSAVFPAILIGHNNNVIIPTNSTIVDGDTTHDDPGLLPLQDNGGPTRTHIPTPGVWDRFHGNNVSNDFWDQRGPGFPRAPAQDPIEIGAYQTNSDIIFVNGFN